MRHVLTAAEAATVLRCDENDSLMLDLLPGIDAYLEMSSGRDWTLDTLIYPEAKSAARMLLVRWHEDPGGMAAGETMGPGIRAALTQLESLALTLKTNGVPDEVLEIAATNIIGDMAVDASLVVVFNHQMATSCTSAVALKDNGGSAVMAVNSLDVTGRILTVNPSSNLAAASNYMIVITDASDIYGQTITHNIGFVTA